jgi:geranylgeranyl reductase
MTTPDAALSGTFDAVVVGGGPAGATAAQELAQRGYAVALLDREGRVKPCGGAVPPALLREFAIPEELLVARARAARMVAPSSRTVEMPVGEGFVGMVDRGEFDEWLRRRAAAAGAVRHAGTFLRVEREADGTAVVAYRPAGEAPDGAGRRLRARVVIGADGATSKVARQCIPGGGAVPFVAAYHEIVRSPSTGEFDGSRCDVWYQGRISPDFYGWVFPHGEVTSVGVGSAQKGFSQRHAVRTLREATGLAGCETVRREGAPIPLRPLARWDDGANVIVAGDAAGVVAPASGEGIYYAMASARFVADAAARFLESGDPRALRGARRSFMRAHGRVFWVLGIMQRFWYSSDGRRERFVSICRDRDVQRLTWDAYMNKRLQRRDPLAHVRIFCKDMAHLLGLVRP